MKLFAGQRPANIGIRDGHLAPVASRPNSVSSQTDSPYHAIAPITYQGTVQDAVKTLLHHLHITPQVRIVASAPDYIRAEFTSRWLGFVDDVEFWFPSPKKIIHVRSASRLGFRDFGVNRRRIETIRSWFPV